MSALSCAARCCSSALRRCFRTISAFCTSVRGSPGAKKPELRAETDALLGRFWTPLPPGVVWPVAVGVRKADWLRGEP